MLRIKARLLWSRVRISAALLRLYSTSVAPTDMATSVSAAAPQASATSPAAVAQATPLAPSASRTRCRLLRTRSRKGRSRRDAPGPVASRGVNVIPTAYHPTFPG